jgi:hypothetical protein
MKHQYDPWALQNKLLDQHRKILLKCRSIIEFGDTVQGIVHAPYYGTEKEKKKHFELREKNAEIFTKYMVNKINDLKRCLNEQNLIGPLQVKVPGLTRSLKQSKAKVKVKA